MGWYSSVDQRLGNRHPRHSSHSQSIGGTGEHVLINVIHIPHKHALIHLFEFRYGEVLRMLGSRGGIQPSRFNESAQLRSGIAARRRHGSLSSLPSSSVSGRPIRDRRRTDDRRKVRDVKSINKRFQRLESHVVTLARSVAHLSSEMRSQHQVSQELERLRDELTALRYIEFNNGCPWHSLIVLELF